MPSLFSVLIFVGCAVNPVPDAYLFAHMIHTDYGRLYYSVSQDGTTWMPLNGGKRITDDYIGHPDICRGHDGRFYLIGNHTERPEIIIWVSDDLVTWSRFVEFAPDLDHIPHFTHGEPHNGAPKIYYDKPSKTYLITWHAPMELASAKEPELMWSSMRTLYVTSKDLTAFSEPKRLFDFEMATIDTLVRREGNHFYAVLKDERMPSPDWPTGKTIRIANAKHLLGPYSFPGPALTDSFREAPTLVPAQKRGSWLLFCEKYPGKWYECFTASNLQGAWKEIKPVFIKPGVRHGAIIPLTKKEYNVIIAAYPNEKGE